MPFIDKTAVNRSGSRSSYPIILTVGNLDESVRFSPLAHRIVGYMPILESRSHQNTVGYKRESWRLRNACFTHLFKSVVDAYKKMVVCTCKYATKRCAAFHVSHAFFRTPRKASSVALLGEVARLCILAGIASHHRHV